MTISFDIMGFDNNPSEALGAIWEYANKHHDLKFIVVGQKKAYQAWVDEHHQLANISFIAAKNKISQSDKPLAYRSKLDNSMRKAIDLVADKKADAVISAGNSGAFIFGTLISISKIKPNVLPAFMPIFPSTHNMYPCLLDVGANINVTPQGLYEFAKMGSAFHKVMFNTKKPSVMLLNIGSEATKGPEHIQEAHQLLVKDKKINFKGNIEARDILKEKANVIVCDGWTGNIALKSCEGAMVTLSNSIKQEIMRSNIFVKVSALGVKKAMRRVGEKYDYRNVGGAFVLGVNGICIKAHGSSDHKSFLGAIKQAHQALKADLITKMKKEI